MNKKAEAIVKKKIKPIKNKLDWNRVEELLAEKLADRVKINLKVRESEEEFDEEDGLEEGDFNQEEIDAEINSREISYFFINRHLNKINKVG
jgi:hypothetical protein